MRTRLGRRSGPILATHEGRPGKGSSNGASLVLFVVKRAVFFILIIVPGLYVLHIGLLAIYSRVLTSPHGHQFEPPGLHPHMYPHGPHGPPPPRDDRSDHLPPPPGHPRPDPSPYSHLLFTNQVPGSPLIESQPPSHERANDVIDTFENYTYASECGISSLDLHIPIHPVCNSRSAVLDAMSFGGRAGRDQPFIPLGCDFKWYSTAEICDVLGRFSHIFVIGDSLQRMIVTALYMLLRENIGDGGVAEWDFSAASPDSPSPRAAFKFEDCACEGQFNRHECSHAPVRLYTDALKYSFAWNRPVCRIPNTDSAHPFEISYHELQQYPVSDADFLDITKVIKSQQRPAKPYAFIFHNTFWNNVNIDSTTQWLDAITANVTEFLPWLPRPAVGVHYTPKTRGFPRLFVTANAANWLKGSQFLATQGSDSIAKFEEDIRPHLVFRDVDMLGFYNMSVQTWGGDGTHANAKTNLLKAMMVVNWLDWVGKEELEGHAWSSGSGGSDGKQKVRAGL